MGGEQFFYHIGSIQRMNQLRKQIFTKDDEWGEEFFVGASIIDDVPITGFVKRNGSILIMEATQPKNTPSLEKSFNTGSPLVEGMIISTCLFLPAALGSRCRCLGLQFCQVCGIKLVAKYEP